MVEVVANEDGKSVKTKIAEKTISMTKKERFDEIFDQQLKGFALALIIFAGIVVNAEKNNVQAGGEINPYRIAYVAMSIITVLGLYKIEHWNANNINLRQLDRHAKEKFHQFQDDAYNTIMFQLLPSAKTPAERAELLSMIPNLMSQLSIGDLKKSINENFMAMVEAITTMFTEILGDKDQKDSDLKTALKNMMDEALNRDPVKKDDEGLLPDGMGLDD